MPEPSLVKILLADNHILFRRGFVSVLQSYPEFKVVGEASDSMEAFTMVNHFRPDVFVVDYDLLDGDGKISKIYRKILAEFKVLVLTGSAKNDNFFTVLEAGARGYLSKEISLEALIQAMHAVAAGHIIISSEIAGKIAETLQRTNGKWNEVDLYSLSPRQKEILGLVAGGLTNKEIATRLFLSEATVKSHMRTIMDKVKAKNRGQAVALASRAGLIPFILLSLTFGAAWVIHYFSFC